MASAAEGQDLQRIERLILEMARTFNWVSLYKAGHPSLDGRVENLHKELIEQVSEEPSGHLLLGVAKDKILYRDTFLGNGQGHVRRFIADLFLHHVATLDISIESTPRELLAFFLCLQRLRTEMPEKKMEDLLADQGVKGIRIHPYNYKEVLSRRIVEAEGEESPSDREDAIWRMLLTENVSTDRGEGGIPPDFSLPSDMMPAILRRAYASAGNGRAGGPASSDNAQDVMSPEMAHRVLSRLGEMLRKLPVEQRSLVLQSLDVDNGENGTDVGGTGSSTGSTFIRALTERHSDGEFIDLLGVLLVAEEKSAERFRRIFGVISSDRNKDGALLACVEARLGDSLRTKNYLARKGWEAVEKLLLSRSEEAYLGRDHTRLIENLSNPAGPAQEGEKPKPAADPAVLAEFEEWNLHLKGAEVLLELLADMKSEGEFLELLEEIRKIIPNVISRKEFPLLHNILFTLTTVCRESPEGRMPAIRRVIGEVDFAQMIDQCVTPDLPAEDRGRIEEILLSFLDISVNPFLDRLLMEPLQGNRRILLSIASRFDGKAVTAIRERLGNPHWYFVRNLCCILGAIGDAEVAPDLIRLLEHNDSRVRKEAIQALGKMQAHDAVPFLGNILLRESILSSQREETTRIEAANALFRCGGTRSVAYLHRGAECRRSKVRQHCATLIRALGSKR